MKVLSAEDQALLILHEVEGRPVAELAVIFEKPVGTIKTRLARGRKKLRERLQRDLATAETIYSVGETTYALPPSETSD
jgi:DNA-directed RNA polymerase specialized sigma24 family protein